MTLRGGRQIVRRDDGDNFVPLISPCPRRYGTKNNRASQEKNLSSSELQAVTNKSETALRHH